LALHRSSDDRGSKVESRGDVELAGLTIHVVVHLGVQRPFRRGLLQVVEQTVLAENRSTIPTGLQLV